MEKRKRRRNGMGSVEKRRVKGREEMKKRGGGRKEVRKE